MALLLKSMNAGIQSNFSILSKLFQLTIVDIFLALANRWQIYTKVVAKMIWRASFFIGLTFSWQPFLPFGHKYIFD